MGGFKSGFARDSVAVRAWEEGAFEDGSLLRETGVPLEIRGETGGNFSLAEARLPGASGSVELKGLANFQHLGSAPPVGTEASPAVPPVNGFVRILRGVQDFFRPVFDLTKDLYQRWKEGPHGFLLMGAAFLLGSGEGGSKGPRPRPYQEKMLAGLRDDLAAGRDPWLGIASPMQTGKSSLVQFLIPEVERLYGPDTRFLILSSSRIITGQMMADLAAGYASEKIGRLDGLVKDPRRITVASIYSLHRDAQLEAFAQGPGRLVVVMDEAYYLQAPIVRKILSRLGVGEEVRNGKQVRLHPVAHPQVTLIGLSGTAGALQGFRMSGSLDLLQALESGWIRRMRAERVFPKVETVKMKSAGERMVWWKPNAASAKALAAHYAEKIQGRYAKSLVYVPTIAHGKLLEAALRKGGEKGVYFVHSEMKPEQIESVLEQWRRRGGALISVRMLSHGFRAGEVGAVFHTYQTSSEELYAQRTGRAWGVREGEGLPPLYVLEATWDRQRFSNLARLFGLVDYPRESFETDPAFIASARRGRENAELEKGQRIRRGAVSPFFQEVPLLESWRRRFQEAVSKYTLDARTLAKHTWLPPEIFDAWSLGAVPTQLAYVYAFYEYLGGAEEARKIFIRCWEEVLEQISPAERENEDFTLRRLFQWRQSEGSTVKKAEVLDSILERRFHPVRRTRQRLDRERFVASFEKAIAYFSSRGDKVSLKEVGRTAAKFYNRGRPKDRQIAGYHFLLKNSGAEFRKQIYERVQSSGILQAPPAKKVEWDLSRAREAFATVLQSLARAGRRVSRKELLEKVRALYARGMPAKDFPSLMRFRNMVDGNFADPDVLLLLHEYPVVDQGRVLSLDRAQVLKAFEIALGYYHKKGRNSVPLWEVAQDAHDFYLDLRGDHDWPWGRTFEKLLMDSSMSGELIQIIRDANIVQDWWLPPARGRH